MADIRYSGIRKAPAALVGKEPNMAQEDKYGPQSGFGVIESTMLLLMVFILGVVILAAYSSASSTRRDAQRVSDVSGLQKALAYFHQEFGQFPQASPSGEAVGTENSFSRFVSKWPEPPSPADGTCSSQNNRYYYEQVNGGESYSIRFCLGDDYGNARAGTRVVTPISVQ